MILVTCITSNIYIFLPSWMYHKLRLLNIAFAKYLKSATLFWHIVLWWTCHIHDILNTLTFFLICQERDVEMWSNIKCCPLVINTKWSWRPISDSLYNIKLQKIFKNKSKFYYTSCIEFFIYANLILDQTFYRKNLLHFHLSHDVKNEKCGSFYVIV